MRLWYQILGGLVLKSLCTWTCFVVMAAELHATELTRPFLHTAFLEGRLTEELVRGHLDAGGSLEEMDHYGHTVLSLAKGEWKSRESYLLEQLGADRERIHQPIYTLVRTFIAGKVEDIPAVLDRWPQYAHLPGLRTSLYTSLISKLPTWDPATDQPILDLIDRLIAMGVPVNAIDPALSPIRQAIIRRQASPLLTTITHRLLDLGADVSGTWLHNGAPKNLLAEVALGERRQAKDPVDGRNVWLRNFDSDEALARRLLALGVPLDSPDLQATSLIAAVSQGNLRLVQMLLDGGIVPSAELRCPASGRRPIDHMTLGNSVEIYVLLLNAGSPLPHLRTVFQMTILVDDGLPKLMKRMVSADWNSDAVATSDDVLARSTLHVAAHHGNLDFVKSLLAVGANADVFNGVGFTPVEIAALQQKRLDSLHAIGVDYNRDSLSMITPRFLAQLQGERVVDFQGVQDRLMAAGAMSSRLMPSHLSLLRQLLQYNPPDGKDVAPWTFPGPHEMEPWPKGVCQPIAQWVAYGSDEVSMEGLLESGWDINASGYRGRTALMHAIMWGNDRTAKLLLAFGADPTLRDDDGKDAYAYRDLYVERFPRLKNVFAEAEAEAE